MDSPSRAARPAHRRGSIARLLALSAAAVGLFGFTGAFARATATTDEPAWSCDFEGTYCGMEEQSKIEPAHRSRFVRVARDGGMAIELTTLPGDDQVHSSRDWVRDDLELPPSPAYCNEGQEEWWAVSVLFPANYVVPKLGEVMDFHQAASGGQPNLNLTSHPGGLRLHGFYGDVKDPDEYSADLGRVRRGVWYDFVYHLKWTSKDDGFLTAWVNGRKVLRHRGPTLYTGIGCYLKLANYHDPVGAPSSIVFARLRRGASAQAVSVAKLED